MTKSELAQPCRMVETINLIGDVWVLLIVHYLLSGPKRFNELQNLLSCISSRTLSQRLQKMVKNQLLERKIYRQIPPKVEYILTPKGQQLQKVIQAINDFADFEKFEQQI